MKPTKRKRFEITKLGRFCGLKDRGFGINFNYEELPDFTEWSIFINFWKWQISIVLFRITKTINN